MCGENDEDGPAALEDNLYSAFLAHTRALLAEQKRRAGADPESAAAYADKLFADALMRSRKDCEAREPNERYTTLSLQPLVFARLAGFLASHLALHEDPLRRVMEAMMHGYAEAEHLEPEHGHDHDDEDHDHDHDHHHHHGHGGHHHSH
jgi:hypothetical protein